MRYDPAMKSVAFAATLIGMSLMVQTALAGEKLEPSTILASTAKYDGATVTVSGKIGKYAEMSTLKGEFTKFELCNSAGTPCVGVVEKGTAHLATGQETTITGVFHEHFSLYGKSGSNVIGVDL
jgi:hypothetical protein